MKFKILALMLSPLIGVLIGMPPAPAALSSATSSSPSVSSPSAAKSAPPSTAPVQTIAMQPELAPAPAASTPDIRWLGYGLFLLQIGWIPLQFVKVQAIQLDE